jgi:hypothetical protein
MNRSLFVLAILFTCSLLNAQNIVQVSSQNKYGTEWENLRKDVNVSFASSDVRFDQQNVPRITQRDQWKATAWRGERIHCQVLIWTNVTISNISVQLSDLKTDKGIRIPSKNILTGFLHYVITDEFAGGCGHRKPQDFDSSLVADAIDTTNKTNVDANSVQPVWISISVPANAVPGLYNGTITVNAGKPHLLKIAVNVLDRVLPPASEWEFDLDLWQHPAAIARVHDVELWSNDHFKYMKPYYTMLANAGQKNMTTSIINEPWNHQAYDDFPSMIKWVKRKDGTWTYDYNLFDKYVSFVMSCGITERINCYTMVPWKMSFPYFDEAAGRDTVLNAQTGTPEYNTFWSAMLIDFARHLKEKGWFEKTAIAMDERPMKDMQAVIALLKSVDTNWKITLAGDYHPEIEKDVYEYCIASRWQFDSSVLQQRKAVGKPSTYYTCCTEPYPNGFTFSPPAEHVWIGWYAAAKGFTGYLRWAYNSWVKDPLKDSRFRTWPAGDTYQVYPGPMTSVRFEKLIEGIQDFEKIRILRDEFIRSGDTQKLNQINQMLAVFEIPALAKTPAAEMVQEAKAVLNRL